MGIDRIEIHPTRRINSNEIIGVIFLFIFIYFGLCLVFTLLGEILIELIYAKFIA